MIDTNKIREAFADHRVGTHFENCELKHRGCAIAKLCDEVDRLRAELEAVRCPQSED